MQITVVFGGPGTGKTSWLANKYKELIKKYKLSEVVFISYTRKQVGNGQSKIKKLTNKKSKDIKSNFRTVHSLSKQSYGKDTDVLDYEICEKMSHFLDVDMTTVARGIDFMKNTLTANDAVGANRAGLDTATFQKRKIFYDAVKEGYSKRGREMVDFADMIVNAVQSGYASKAKAVLVDECQDLSSLQWRAIYSVFSNVKEAYFAGDPNQALYRFAGGASNYMLDMRCDNTVFLEQSKRCSQAVMDMASLIWKNMSKKVDIPRPANHQGFAVFYPEKNLQATFIRPIIATLAKGKSILVLANTYYQLTEMERLLLDGLNIPHNFIAGRRKDYCKGKDKVNLVFSTVHQAKGLEADYVIYDVSCGRSGEKSDYGTKAERYEDYWRIVYTGITRAREGIIACQIAKPTADEPSCLETLYYSKFNFHNYKEWLGSCVTEKKKIIVKRKGI